MITEDNIHSNNKTYETKFYSKNKKNRLQIWKNNAPIQKNCEMNAIITQEKYKNILKIINNSKDKNKKVL